MNLHKQFLDFIEKEKLFHRQDRLLVAVSGGVDSIVLCHLCKQSGFSFAIAHCNFQLRNGESDADENFVKSVAKEMGVECFIKKFDTEGFAKENKLSIQE